MDDACLINSFCLSVAMSSSASDSGGRAGGGNGGSATGTASGGTSAAAFAFGGALEPDAFGVGGDALILAFGNRRGAGSGSRLPAAVSEGTPGSCINSSNVDSSVMRGEGVYAGMRGIGFAFLASDIKPGMAAAEGVMNLTCSRKIGTLPSTLSAWIALSSITCTCAHSGKNIGSFPGIQTNGMDFVSTNSFPE